MAKPNILDRAIEAIAPGYALRRAAARDTLMSYRGAIANRGSRPWNRSTSVRGGVASDLHDLASMRDRARNVFRRNVIGRSLLITETDNVVADGFSLQMRSDDPVFNAEAEKRFYGWLDGADITGKHKAVDLFRLSWSEPRKDGDGGFILAKRGGYPYLQYIPGDLIGSPFGVADGPDVIDGIKCDPAGRPKKFLIREVDAFGVESTATIDADDFVYLAHLDDPNALRGATVYAPIFEHLDQLDDYREAVVVAARMAAIFGLIHKTKNPAAALGGLGTLTNSAGEQQKAVTLENGMLKVHGTEDDIYQVQAQQPMQQTPDFIRAMFRIICLQFDMPLEIGNKDLSQVNFSGGRIGLIGFYRSCRVKQDWLRSHCWNRIVFWWLSVERERQRLGYPDSFRTPFPEGTWGEFVLNGREWDYNDPYKEAQADQLEMEIGIKSPQQACEERGRDWLEIVRQRKEANRILAENGLSAAAKAVDGADAADPSSDVDAFGVAVRSGAMTPQIEDEIAFRTKLGFPPMSEEVRAAWQSDGGVRRPITLATTDDGTTPQPEGTQP